MVISIAKTLGSAEAGVIAVVALAIGNGAGRVVAGAGSDKLGRKLTLSFFLLFHRHLTLDHYFCVGWHVEVAGLTLDHLQRFVSKASGQSQFIFSQLRELG